MWLCSTSSHTSGQTIGFVSSLMVMKWGSKLIDIVIITFLQHTDLSIPYYPSTSWNFLRGAASTVDRDFGFIGRVIIHGAIENHVVHHHSSRIPFYHAAEATAAIRKVMGVHYQKDKTPYVWAFWKNFRQCRYVEETAPGSKVFFFKKSE